MGTYLNIVQIIIAITLTGLVLMQGHSHGTGGVFGGQPSVYQSRRGPERTIFNLTIFFAVLFLLISLLNVIIAG